MQFSKLKKMVEGLLCDSLKRRVGLHAAVYRHSHDDQARVWLTFDKRQILSASDLSFSLEHYHLEQALKEQYKLQPIPYNDDWEVMLNSPERKALIAASDQAEEELVEAGVWGSRHFYQALLNYPNLSIEEALTSENSLIRAFALFDRRVGKRRLLKMEHFEHPVEGEFFKIRCEVEGLNNGPS
ncbi:SF0329 family protein [Ureibacillus aquaedulcis]|uniref:Nonribosomal peptide synthetase n=1 Tax=Ureibacillus aquaedulcis TaxID=3058421 RepID=A0ABT8GVN4_9BACL|nr:nonribosomal peptide synthetase [Ureibacillus sp. BA0131]MDN4495421.1 nonribosomal peptide synthetase [Ureibacillus sp. BA0131]